MRERHKHKFLEATAALRSQHKTLAKRVKLLETQLLKNSVKCADSCLCETPLFDEGRYCVVL